jgi:hypothetical protein
MSIPTPFEGLRLPVDDWVDRPDLEAPQGVEVTGTNRPRACPQLLASTVLVLKPRTTPLSGHGNGAVFESFIVFRWS